MNYNYDMNPISYKPTYSKMDYILGNTKGIGDNNTYNSYTNSYANSNNNTHATYNPISITHQSILSKGDQDKQLKLLWDNLGVYDDYRNLFTNIADSLRDKSKAEFIQFEIDNLKKFEELLLVKYFI